MTDGAQKGVLMGIAVGVLSANYLTDTGEVSHASSRKTEFSSAFENAVQKATRDSFEHGIDDENPQRSTAYTRCITANLKVQNMVAGENEDGKEISTIRNTEKTEFSRHDSVTNPSNGKEIPIDARYITCYTPEGIICTESRKVGDEVTNKKHWEISYDSQDQYEKVQRFLSEFSEDDRLLFAANESFWKDFLNDSINLDEFKAFYQTTNNGRIDVEGQLAEGKSLREIIDGPYSKYFNNKDLMGKMYTAEELQAKLMGGIKTGVQTKTQELGMGTILTKGMGYGLSASQVIDGSSEDVIIRVKVSLGGGATKSVDVNLSEVNPASATAIEMFAYCQYADANGSGVNHSFGSWNALKNIMDSSGKGFEFSSLDEAMSKKINWNKGLSPSGTALRKESTGQVISATDLIEMLKETQKALSEHDKEEDWRNMDDEEWEKLLASLDINIDAMRAAIQEEIEKAQKETSVKSI